jgi:hypothetical protein
MDKQPSKQKEEPKTLTAERPTPGAAEGDLETVEQDLKIQAQRQSQASGPQATVRPKKS